MKTAYIINYFTNEKGDGKPTEKDNITIYLSKEDYKEGNFESRFKYENIKKSNYLMLDNFFEKLRELKNNGYELVFKCDELIDKR